MKVENSENLCVWLHMHAVPKIESALAQVGMLPAQLFDTRQMTYSCNHGRSYYVNIQTPKNEVFYDYPLGYGKPVPPLKT